MHTLWFPHINWLPVHFHSIHKSPPAFYQYIEDVQTISSDLFFLLYVQNMCHDYDVIVTSSVLSLSWSWPNISFYQVSRNRLTGDLWCIHQAVRYQPNLKVETNNKNKMEEVSSKWQYLTHWEPWEAVPSIVLVIYFGPQQGAIWMDIAHTLSSLQSKVFPEGIRLVNKSSGESISVYNWCKEPISTSRTLFPLFAFSTTNSLPPSIAPPLQC